MEGKALGMRGVPFLFKEWGKEYAMYKDVIERESSSNQE